MVEALGVVQEAVVTPDIIAAIDTAVGCQRCGKPLEASVSDDFCSEGCQQAWHASRAEVSSSAGSLVAGPILGSLASAVHADREPEVGDGMVAVLSPAGDIGRFRYDGAQWVRLDRPE